MGFDAITVPLGIGGLGTQKHKTNDDRDAA
jgi:hypothetical protein